YLPVIGREDGSLCVLDWYTGTAQCHLQAHSPWRVTALISSPENNFIISSGSDLTVKVWRIFAYSEESLNLHMSFFCSQSVGLMVTLRSKLLVAFHDPGTATYSLVQYCLRTQTRSAHPPTDDHQDQITGLCGCPRLRLVATSSKDRMIRIWNEENQLLRILCLSSVPESLAFSSDRGELLLGIHRHVYSIDLTTMLPFPYQVKLMCMESLPLVPDPCVPVPETVLRSLSKRDKRRLTEPRSSLS
ncbi:WD repeat-containing protein 97-like, partial [Ascaphus truei]|uniref:WD repeat-containing protein 97-like n=1 Tax=Ascaphus truei TaxID=8439 RepID=UPI003F59181E